VWDIGSNQNQITCYALPHCLARIFSKAKEFKSVQIIGGKTVQEEQLF
jgi:hypothetical protein